MAVYFISDGNGSVKIGHSWTPEQRLREMQAGSTYALKLMRVIKGGKAVEKWLHKRYASRRIRGEWFHLDQEMKVIIPPVELLPKKGSPTGYVKKSRVAFTIFLSLKKDREVQRIAKRERRSKSSVLVKILEDNLP